MNALFLFVLQTLRAKDTGFTRQRFLYGALGSKNKNKNKVKIKIRSLRLHAAQV